MFRVEKFQTNKFSDLCFSWGKSKNMYKKKFKNREEDRYCLAERDKLGKLCVKYKKERDKKISKKRTTTTK